MRVLAAILCVACQGAWLAPSIILSETLEAHYQRSIGAAAAGDRAGVFRIDLGVNSEPVVIEQLRFFRAGELGTARTESGREGEFNLRLASADVLFVRFSRRGKSPVTVAVAELPRGEAWKLPRAIDGGELVAVVEAADIMPTEFLVVGMGRTITLPVPQARIVAIQGLVEGAYRLTPKYAGGLRGESEVTRVKTGESLLGLVPPQPVGAVQITLDPSVCTEETTTTIRRVVAGHQVEQRSVFTSNRSADCLLLVAGLAPGAYEVTVGGRNDGLEVRRPFDVAAQAVALTTISAPATWLSGNILLNGHPFPGASMSVLVEPASAPGRGEDVRVPVLSAGAFQLRLPKPGQYFLRLVHGSVPLLGVERVTDVRDGENFLEWNVTGGVLAIDVSGWDRSSPLEFSMSRASAGREGGGVSTNTLIPPSAELPLTLPGMAFGDYRVRVRQRRQASSPRTSQLAAVVIDVDNPEQSVQLTLMDYVSTVRVQDSNGMPFLGVEVTTPLGRRIGETGPGEFQLSASDTSPGESLLISFPGHVPACRSAPEQGGTHVVTLQPGLPGNIQYVLDSPGAVSPRPGGTISWPGNECPVAVDRLEWTFLEASADGTVWTFRITHLPSVGSATFHGEPWKPVVPVEMLAGPTWRIDLRGR